MQRILKAIQERKIDRVAAAYGVAAWLLVQAASIGLPTFGAPAWTMKVMIVAALVGFPLVLWIAWHVAAPAHGMADEVNVSLRRTDMALLGVLGVLIVLVGGQFAYELGAFHPKKPASIATASTPPSPLQAAAPAASIAVLPFLNLSGDPKKDFFSDGISEELLNDLANAPKLRVAARTSCFAFKGKNEDIRKIARALNVRAILEGSVREDGQHIRITAQLINATDGYHIWSKTFDRDLSNILQVQDEIAQAITVALTHTLNGGSSAPQKPSRPAIDPDAYRNYLKAQALSALKTDEGDSQAVELLRTVTAREPNFAPAFAALGRTYVHMAEFHNQRPDLLESAAAALNKALKLDPKNLEALSTDLRVAALRWNWQRTSQDARALLAINPHNVFTLRGLSFYYAAFGFAERQAAALREATRLDPLSFVDLNNLATAYNSEGRYLEAVSAARRALALKPDRPLTLYTLCWATAGAKQFDQARQLVQQLSELHQAAAADACTLWTANLGSDLPKAQRLADAIAVRVPVFIFDEASMGEFYALSGDYSSAILWLKRAYANHNASFLATAYLPTTPKGLLEAPGWKKLMARHDVRLWQAARERVR
ncbi:MAG TPA: tetratricopeptide repeat protein [Rhizomicrobium sp.]|nr:tetratricopeptide repeat protein [Rhizomicrobium sp.]